MSAAEQFDEAACRKTCDVCDMGESHWPCAKKEGLLAQHALSERMTAISHARAFLAHPDVLCSPQALRAIIDGLLAALGEKR